MDVILGDFSRAPCPSTVYFEIERVLAVNAKHAWAVIAGWVLTWNVYALLSTPKPDRQLMLSEQMGLWRRKYPWVYLAIFVVSGHLAHIFGDEHDPITNGFGYARKGVDSLKGAVHHG